MSNPNWGSDPSLAYRWRTGRKLGRTIYMQIGPEPSDEDEFIGLMDTADLAEQIVVSHNERREARGR